MKQIDILITILSKIYFLLCSFNTANSSFTVPENSHPIRRGGQGQLYIIFPGEKDAINWLQDAQFPHASELFTIEEATAYMNISRSTLDRLRKEGRISTIKYGRAVRFLKTEIEEARIWYSIPRGKC